MWRTTSLGTGSKEKRKWIYTEWPCKCEECSEPIQERHGCGWRDGFKGRGTVRLATTGEEVKDCPQWLARQPFICSVYEHLSDYKEGRLGNSLDLPSAFLDYLKAANGESIEWVRLQQEKMFND
jgi:hypothetical protein